MEHVQQQLEDTPPDAGGRAVIDLDLNGQAHASDTDPGTPLSSGLRDRLPLERVGAAVAV